MDCTGWRMRSRLYNSEGVDDYDEDEDEDGNGDDDDDVGGAARAIVEAANMDSLSLS